MGKRIKWTIETVKEKCEEHGIECLEKEYVNNATKMRFKCKCENEYVARWSDVVGKNQWQCSECSGLKKWTIEMIKEKCREHGIECLEEKYVDNKTKMRFKCNCGNEYEAKWNTVTTQNQWQCRECSNKKLAEKRKLDFDEIKRKCEDNKIECLEKEYVNANTKMRFKCKCGNEFETSWSNVTRQNQWQCLECGRKNGAEKQKLDFNEIKRKCGEHGIECLEDKYVNNATKMRFRCNCGNVYEATWNTVANENQWQCPECGIKNRVEKQKLDFEEIKRICEEHGIECLEKEYVNTNTKMRFRCNCGNEYVARWSQVIGNSQWQCPKCSSKTSRGEIITSEFLSNLLKDENSFEEQKTFEDLADKGSLSYDFFISKFNILIEIQGSQHYKPVEKFGGEEQFKIQQHHDRLKREYAEQNGYTLIEIPWNCNGINTEEKLIEELKNKLSGLIK